VWVDGPPKTTLTTTTTTTTMKMGEQNSSQADRYQVNAATSQVNKTQATSVRWVMNAKKKTVAQNEEQRKEEQIEVYQQHQQQRLQR
jgi:hypothetical protein